MNEPLQNEVQGPGVLIIRLVSLLTTMKAKNQTLEKELQKIRKSEAEARSKLALLSGAQLQEASDVQKESITSREIQMRQNVIPVLKLQIQSLSSKIQCDALEIKQLTLEKEQHIKELTIIKHQVSSFCHSLTSAYVHDFVSDAGNETQSI
jgi:hypothetical protein